MNRPPAASFVGLAGFLGFIRIGPPSILEQNLCDNPACRRILQADRSGLCRRCALQQTGVTKCNRTACDSPANLGLVHRDNGKAYCPKCARDINEQNGEVLIPWTPQPRQRPAGEVSRG